MKKGMMAGMVLSVSLLLTACGGEGGQETCLGRAAGWDETEILLEVDGREVPAWRYLYWLARDCRQLAQEYQEAGQPLDWQSILSGGKTLGEYVKTQALADTALYATVENWAEIYGCVQEQTPEAADEAWQAYAQTQGGEEKCLETLEKEGLNRQRWEELAAAGRAYGALYQLFSTPGSLLAPVEGELEQFARDEGWVRVDRILVARGEDDAAASEKAAQLFSQLNVAENQEQTFTALAQAGDDTGRPWTFRLGDGVLDSSLEEAAVALEEGQCSGILESEEGYSILRRLPLDTTALAAEYFDHLLMEAAEAAEITAAAAYENLDTAAFWQALTEE